MGQNKKVAKIGSYHSGDPPDALRIWQHLHIWAKQPGVSDSVGGHTTRCFMISYLCRPVMMDPSHRIVSGAGLSYLARQR
jgi:hypothetical protein